MDTKVDFPSRREFLKGLALGTGGYILGSCLIHPNEAIGQSIEGYLEKVPMETRWRVASSLHAAALVRVWKAAYDKEGREKYLELVKQRTSVSGPQLKRFADSLGFTGNDAKSMATIMPVILIIGGGPTQKFEIEEATSEKARLKCINCVYWDALQAQKITDDVCSAGSHYQADAFAKAMNSNMTSTLVKARPRGDSVCEWVIELKA